MSGLNLYESTAADLANVTARLQKAIDLATAYRALMLESQAAPGEAAYICETHAEKILDELLRVLKP